MIISETLLIDVIETILFFLAAALSLFSVPWERCEFGFEVHIAVLIRIVLLAKIKK